MAIFSCASRFVRDIIPPIFRYRPEAYDVGINLLAADIFADINILHLGSDASSFRIASPHERYYFIENDVISVGERKFHGMLF